MKKHIDGRKLDRNSQETLRIQAIRRVEEDGESVTSVMSSIGMSRTVYYSWRNDYKSKGIAGLKRKHGSGSRPKIGKEYNRQIISMIDKHDPRDYGYEYALWTLDIIKDLIFKKFSINLSRSAICNLLSRLGVTVQKPLRRSYERDEKLIEEWRTKTYPKIVKKARKRGAEIFFEDESGFESDTNLGKTWGKRGSTPVVKISGQRQKLNAISMVCPLGKFWFSTYTSRFNSVLFISHLKMFLRNRKKPIVLILDGHPVHKSKLVSKLVQDLKGKLTIEFLPPYAPDLNPDEFVWKDAKDKIKKMPLAKNQSLNGLVTKSLNQIKNSKRKLKGFFMAKSVRYSVG